jgi:hypothetical protein
VLCSDIIGLTNSSETRIFYIDTLAPQINLYYPNGDNIYAANITFNFSVIDFIEQNISCNLTVNSSVVDINFTAQNGSVINRTISGITDGYKIWNVICWDGAGNLNTSTTFNFTRYTNPSVTLISPENNTWFNTSSIILEYLPEDDEGITNVSLFINGIFNRTNSSSILNQNYNNFSIIGFANGEYYWNVNVTDSTGLTGIGIERKFYIDTIAPSLILNYPNESLEVNSNNVTFNFTIQDNLSQNINCTLLVDGELESSENYSGDLNVIKYSILADGNHTWNVICMDEALNINNSIIINFTIEAPPNVNLNLPANNFITKDSSILFNYTVSDLIGVSNCDFYLDGEYNITKTDILLFPNETGRLNNFTIEGISEGLHNWTIKCNDSDFNYAGPSSRNFSRDLSPPFVVLNSPENNSGIDFNEDRVYFNWTGLDELDTILQCNLTIDGVVRQPNIWVSNATPKREYVLTSVLGQGEHYWNVTCWDQMKNSNTSELRKFNLTYPDFYVNSSEIFLNETSPRENQSVQLNATVYNLAGADIENITVRFYKNDPDSGGIQIGTDILVDLSKFNSAIVSTTWIAPLGPSQIFVIIDPPLATNGSYQELNESNNKADKTFNVGSWHFFYGEVITLSDVVLADSGSDKLVNWSPDGFNTGNVYVTDYDSYISWNNLKAIGKGKNDSDSSSDFLEIDSILNSSVYEDSVYDIYTNLGVIKEKRNLLLFNKLIQEIPVINSTNNSNFITGILWDYSDDTNGTNGEFDSADKEDLIFVAPVNKHALGTYGTYDYEVRVPAKLREYKTTNTKSASFYVEIA